MVGIIAANNIRFSPYIQYYTRILDKLGVSYELIYPDRMNVEDSFSSTSHVLSWNKKMPTPLAYYDYSRSVKSVITDRQYKLLIVLTTNNAVYLATWLKKKYNKKYILDIRDYTHENIPIYFALEKIAVNHSLLNVISSRKFTSFLPSGEYVVCHNMNPTDSIDTPVINLDKPISIGYVGKGAYLDNCAKICKKVCSDSRFRFSFYGISKIPEELETYRQYNNIDFHGLFLPNEKEAIIQNIDILFNVYGNGKPLLDHALSNKLYDALSYGKPILTSPGTYMSEVAGPYAFDVDFTRESFLDDMYMWYINLNPETLVSYVRHTLKEFENEGKQTEDIIVSTIRDNI